ncbi:hypothetical protein FPANT_12197 [Fusarium pseudoanthophilum]|uniref:Uncharacterized protein n=1 Tax=Fusarium pseudoanthophilum TaxID=48495 RepID=A0A8H5NP40_9HYPO|nr:hypothetical protein FPANT_12197 [Fusarium pseudoanthophilum]
MGTQIQSLGRLWRMQQLKAVTWEILHQGDSYDAFLNTRNCEKIAHNMAAEGNINPAITGQYRIIYAYELIRAIIGHESNQYSRLRVQALASKSKEESPVSILYDPLRPPRLLSG